MVPINKPTIVRKDLEYVLNCLITERLAEGELTQEFEKAITHYINVKYSLATNSFTSAMHLGLLSLGVKPADEVIISSYAEASLLNALNYIKAKPILADLEMETYNIDFKQVKKLITRKTKAIIVNHNFGIPADMDKFLTLDIPVIEDCSYAFGAEYESEIYKERRMVGSFGLIAVFSFDTDTIITTGNGGMLVSQKKDLITKAKRYKYNPFLENIEYQIQYDYRMPDIAAALGLSQIKIMKKLLERRLELSSYYNERFKQSKYKVYKEIDNRKNVYSRYTVFLEGNLEKAIYFLRRNKIDARKPVPEPAYILLGKDGNNFPNASHCYNKLIEIPVYPSLKKNEAEKIANTLLKVL